MRLRFGTVLSTVVTVAVGVITLVGLLIGPELGGLWVVANDIGRLPLFARLFVQITVLIVALMILLGLVNLLTVHLTRLRRGEGRPLNRVNSLLLLISFVGTLLFYVYDRSSGIPYIQSVSYLLLERVQIAIESALAALLFFSLVYGASRILHREVSLYRVLFVAMILVVLIAALPLPQLNVVTDFYDWLLLVPVNAGARGLLIGIGLATALTGLRVLFGQDKTYH